MLHSIYYASKVLNDAQVNFATTKQELLAIANFKVAEIIPHDLNWHQQKKFFRDAHSYV